jgi:hypothetical protein
MIIISEREKKIKKEKRKKKIENKKLKSED